MTIMLKSNVKATQFLSGFQGALSTFDSWTFGLDFENQKFQLKKSQDEKPIDVKMNDVLRFSRASKATILTRYKTIENVGNNEPRFDFDEKLNVSGLRFESAKTNYLYNSRTPTTQTVTLPATSRFFGLKIKGAGSVIASGNINFVTTNTVATEGASVVFTLKDDLSQDVTFEVTGDVSFFHCETMRSSAYISSFIETFEKEVQRANDVASLSSDVVKKTGTILFNFTVPGDEVPKGVTLTENWIGGILNLSNIAGDHIAVGGVFRSESLRVRTFMDGIEYLTYIPQQVGKTNTIALSYGNGKLLIACNGIFAGEMSIPSNFNPSQLKIGGTDGWATLAWSGLLRKMLIAETMAEVDQLAIMSSSWRR